MSAALTGSVAIVRRLRRLFERLRLGSWNIETRPMLAQFLSQIAHDRRGSVAQIFALALIPVAFMAGAAIDYTRSVAERSELQVAVDAAVLAGAKDASQTWTTTAANV